MINDKITIHCKKENVRTETPFPNKDYIQVTITDPEKIETDQGLLQGDDITRVIDREKDMEMIIGYCSTKIRDYVETKLYEHIDSDLCEMVAYLVPKIFPEIKDEDMRLVELSEEVTEYFFHNIAGEIAEKLVDVLDKMNREGL